jgi:hypothetical protein
MTFARVFRFLGVSMLVAAALTAAFMLCIIGFQLEALKKQQNLLFYMLCDARHTEAGHQPLACDEILR